VCLERTHADLPGQGEGLAVVGFDLRSFQRLTPRRNVVKREPSSTTSPHCTNRRTVRGAIAAREALSQVRFQTTLPIALVLPAVPMPPYCWDISSMYCISLPIVNLVCTLALTAWSGYGTLETNQSARGILGSREGYGRYDYREDF
jgi:hypothetical protein